MNKPTFEELQRRIETDLACYRGKALGRAALAWDGYLAALIEWGLITVGEHEDLLKLLPHIENSPAVAILLGRPEDV